MAVNDEFKRSILMEVDTKLSGFEAKVETIVDKKFAEECKILGINIEKEENLMFWQAVFAFCARAYKGTQSIWNKVIGGVTMAIVIWFIAILSSGMLEWFKIKIGK
jgi:prepilin signal peptidase PulO-like enzyme (type II secretory pathway)